MALPDSSLGRIHTADISSDLSLLAFSQRTRGGVWDLHKGQRLLHTRGFRGANLTPDGHLVADFPQQDKTPRTMAELNLRTGDADGGYQIAELQDEKKEPENDLKAKLRIQHSGPYLFRLQAHKQGLLDDCDFEVADARTKKVLWQRKFPREVPYMAMDGDTLVYRWDIDSHGAEPELESSPTLKARYDALPDKRGVELLVTVDAATGMRTGAAIVDTGRGSFQISGIRAAGPWIVVQDSQKRIQIYSREDGERKSVVFGAQAVFAPKGDLLMVESEPGHVTAYDPRNGEKRREYTFPSAISWMHFSTDGNRLFVLTRNQHAYWLDATAGSEHRQRSSAGER